jgi:hypothetical protein
MSSDLSDLGEHSGDYPKAARWNAEHGGLAVSSFNIETGQRELQPVAFGCAESTFVLDLGRRMRGFSMYRPGVYDARLTPVGSPPPEWPNDPDFKPCVSCLAWNPHFGEVRFETNANLFRSALLGVWERALATEEAVRGEQPVIRFMGAAEVFIRAINKTFMSPIIHTIGFMPRDQVPPWAKVPPTVPPPKPAPLLGVQSEVKKVTQATPEETAPARRHKAARPDSSPFDEHVPSQKKA